VNLVAGNRGIRPRLYDELSFGFDPRLCFALPVVWCPFFGGKLGLGGSGIHAEVAADTIDDPSFRVVIPFAAGAAVNQLPLFRREGELSVPGIGRGRAEGRTSVDEELKELLFGLADAAPAALDLGDRDLFQAEPCSQGFLG